MNHLLRRYFFSLFSLWITRELLPTLFISPGWQPLLVSAFVLTLLSLLIVPILKILFIPINIMTFGLLSWVVHVVTVYLLTVVVPEIEIRPWTSPGMTWSGFVIPSIHFSYLGALVITSLLITFFINLLSHIHET